MLGLSPVGWILLIVIVIMAIWIFLSREDLTYQAPPDDNQTPPNNNQAPPRRPRYDVPEPPAVAPEPQGTTKPPSKGERICKQCLEELLGKPFNKIRPNWLKNPETNHNLELDCYNEELQLAIEYNGEQHYRYPNYFHKTEQEFIDQVRRDIMKETLCTLNGIKLIVVPYTVPHQEIRNFLIAELTRHRVL